MPHGVSTPVQKPVISRLMASLASALPRQLQPRFAHRTSYYKHCKRALTQALAPHWQGSRAALKERVRAWMSPRRRDVGFLSRVLAATAMPAIMAAIALGAAPQARAQTICEYQFSAAAPLSSISLGLWARSDFADLDSDGDLDAVTGEKDGFLRYFRNTGSRSSATFTEMTGASSPFNGFPAFDKTAPALGDIDADGDLDLAVGLHDGTFLYYRNTGSAAVPVFTQQTGVDNPLGTFDLPYYSSPAFVDVDADGDLDAFAACFNAPLAFFRNTGTPTSPAFSQVIGAEDPFSALATTNLNTIEFCDLDGDGDQDCLASKLFGGHAYFRNDGTATAPAFTLADMPATLATGFAHMIATADLDGDSDLEIIATDYDAVFTYHQNDSSHAKPIYLRRTGVLNPMDSPSWPFGNVPMVDIDGDGDLDIFTGSSYVNPPRFYLNTGTDTAPVMEERTGTDNPLSVLGNTISANQPGFADIDGDGDQDAIIANFSGTFVYYRNAGSVSVPSFTLVSGVSDPFNGLDVGNYSTICFADIDADGDLDLVSGDWDGRVRFFRNSGTVIAPAFSEQTGGSNPFDGIDVGDNSTPQLTDADNDGDLDLMIGEAATNINYFENTGTLSAPVYTERTGTENPFTSLAQAGYGKYSFGDIDGDGDLDIFAGTSNSIIRYFEAITDCTPPTAICQDATVQLDEDGAANFDQSLVNNESFDNEAIALSEVDVTGFDCEDIGQQTVTLTITDTSGNQDSCTATVTVEDSELPVITLTGDSTVTINCGSAYTDAGVTVADNCDADISATVGGDVVNPNEPGEYTITYDAADDSGNDAVQVTRTVTVEDVTPPVITLNSDATFYTECGSPFVDPGASVLDSCDTSISVVIGDDVVNPAVPGEYVVTYDAEDVSGNDAVQVTRTVIVQDTAGPVITVNGDSYTILECGSPFTDPGASAIDACEGPTQVVTGGDTVDPNTPGHYNITYTATDSNNNQGQNSRIVFVRDTVAPTITLVGDETITVDCNSTFTDPGVSAVDACDQDITINVTGDIVNTAVQDTYVINYTGVDDDENVSNLLIRTVIVADITAPVLTLNGDSERTIECHTGYSDPGVSVTEACDADVEVQVGGDVVDPNTPGVYTVTYDATDAKGNAAEQVTRTVTVADSTPPVITLNGDAIVTVPCHGDYVDASAALQEACDSNIDLQVDGNVIDTDIAGEYTITYSAVDAEGNEAIEVSRTVIVEDNEPPLISLNGEPSLTLNCGETFTDPGATAFDDCAGVVDILPSGGPVVQGQPGEYVFTYNASDPSGNQATEVTRTITVLDNCPPEGEGGVDGEGEGEGIVERVYSADSDGNGVLDLSEVLRVVQFFNALTLHCDNTTEDGYSPTEGDLTCLPHTADYAPQDWSISLSELLRAIQFYNLGAVQQCPGQGEDGYCTE